MTITTNKDTAGLERHTQTILTAVIAGAIGWVGWSVTSQSEVLATLTERVSHLQLQVERMSERPSLTVNDFNIMASPILSKVSNNKEDIGELKRRLVKMEEDLYIKYMNPRKKIAND